LFKFIIAPLQPNTVVPDMTLKLLQEAHIITRKEAHVSDTVLSPGRTLRSNGEGKPSTWWNIASCIASIASLR
jgi:hypothetical protein